MEPHLSLHLQRQALSEVFFFSLSPFSWLLFSLANRLSWNYMCRYEKVLPGVDVFVCTADPTIEPPIMVINTVLSVMAYNYPSHKLSVYLSDDGGSDLTFYALLEASCFSELWLPFCRKFKIEPRSPAAYFSSTPQPNDCNPPMPLDWFSVKVLTPFAHSLTSPFFFEKIVIFCLKISLSLPWQRSVRFTSAINVKNKNINNNKVLGITRPVVILLYE